MTHKLVKLFESFIVSLVVIPLILLALGKLRFQADWLYIVVAVILTVLITWILQKVFGGKSFRSFIAMAVLTIAAINLDLLTGSNLIQSSVLGYDPMVGARYYGIGNEFMGILVGCTIVVSAALYEKFKQRWVLGFIALFLLLECYIIAGPSIGANSDGFTTAPFAFLVTLLLLGDIRIRPGLVLGVGLVILCAVFGVSYYDMQRPVEMQSHIGRAASNILSGGWQQGFIIISRKMAMNLKLIKYTIWSRVFIVILLVIPVLLFRPVGAMKELRQQHPYLVKGFGGIIVGALVGMVVNDSGIVVASTMSIYLVVPLLLLMLEQQKEDID